MTTDRFTDADRRQMDRLGISLEEVERQLALFREPPPFVRLSRPATPGDGILRLAEAPRPARVARYEAAARAGCVAKFVPASGAASRMFRSLLAYLAAPLGGGPQGPVDRFFAELPRFPFYEPLAAAARSDLDPGGLAGETERRRLLELLLGSPGLGYAELPKGLIPFHRYAGGARTPFEEHLVEAAAYLRSAEGRARLHFTVSPEHEAEFRRVLSRTLAGPPEAAADSRFEVRFSHQSHATDTLAVDLDDRPFRQEDGSLLFRPGGHGALLGNLAASDAELVFIKNIDNVVPEDRQGTVVLWKKLLGGTLLAIRERVFELLGRLEAGDAGAIAAAARFLAEELARPLPSAAPDGDEELTRRLIEGLDRPLRVCGVVENVGEPGGGPFWVASATGELSLQIVEGSQVDPDSEAQQALLRSSTHFNPVDLACSLRDRRGRPYPLERFVDPATVFLARKSHEGRAIKALERPGLWNGAMAGWNTVFVEVPLATFAPVKTVFDLLRPEHQPAGG